MGKTASAAERQARLLAEIETHKREETLRRQRISKKRQELNKATRLLEASAKAAEKQEMLQADQVVGARLLDGAHADAGIRNWMQTAFPRDTHADLWRLFELTPEERQKRRDPRGTTSPIQSTPRVVQTQEAPPIASTFGFDPDDM